MPASYLQASRRRRGGKEKHFPQTAYSVRWVYFTVVFYVMLHGMFKVYIVKRQCAFLYTMYSLFCIVYMVCNGILGISCA